MSVNDSWIIYGLREAVEGSLIRYVGCTTVSGHDRLRIHFNDSKRKTTPVCSWIKSLDFNVSMDVIEACPEGDIDHLYSREIFWIDHYRELQGSLTDKRTPSYLKNYLNGGGSGNIGIPLSDEHKEAIKAGVVKHFTENGHKPVYDFWLEKYGEEHANRLRDKKRQKASKSLSGEGNPMFGRTGLDSPVYGRVGDLHPMFGTHNSDEARARISAATKGRPKSEATKVRMSYANHVRFHLDKIKDTCKWCLGADLQEEIQKRELELNDNKLE